MYCTVFMIFFATTRDSQQHVVRQKSDTKAYIRNNELA